MRNPETRHFQQRRPRYAPHLCKPSPLHSSNRRVARQNVCVCVCVCVCVSEIFFGVRSYLFVTSSLLRRKKTRAEKRGFFVFPEKKRGHLVVTFIGARLISCSCTSHRGDGTPPDFSTRADRRARARALGVVKRHLWTIGPAEPRPTFHSLDPTSRSVVHQKPTADGRPTTTMRTMVTRRVVAVVFMTVAALLVAPSSAAEASSSPFNAWTTPATAGKMSRLLTLPRVSDPSSSSSSGQRVGCPWDETTTEWQGSMNNKCPIQLTFFTPVHQPVLEYFYHIHQRLDSSVSSVFPSVTTTSTHRSPPVSIHACFTSSCLRV